MSLSHRRHDKHITFDWISIFVATDMKMTGDLLATQITEHLDQMRWIQVHLQNFLMNTNSRKYKASAHEHVPPKKNQRSNQHGM